MWEAWTKGPLGLILVWTEYWEDKPVAIVEADFETSQLYNNIMGSEKDTVWQQKLVQVKAWSNSHPSKASWTALRADWEGG